MNAPPAQVRILDGPTGTELEARGFRSHDRMWTARAAIEAEPLLFAIHRDYALAGAQLLTAHTFRTTAHAAAQVGVSSREAKRWLQAAVSTARAAAQSVRGDGLVPPQIAGSLAPLADCYHPEATPEDAVLMREHRRTAEWLLEAGCELLLIETQGCGREARLALAEAVRAAEGSQTPIWVSFLPTASGATLLDGTPLLACAQACAAAGAAAILCNCADLELIERALATLEPLRRSHQRLALGAYPNARRMDFVDGAWHWRESAPGPADADADADVERSMALVRAARRYAQKGAAILGACCGHRPVDIAALARGLRATADPAALR